MFFVISFSLRLNKEIRRWRKKDVVDVACVNCTIRGHDHWSRVWKIWIFRYKNVSKNTTTGHLMCLKNGPYNIASLGWLNVQFHMIGATFDLALIIFFFYWCIGMRGFERIICVTSFPTKIFETPWSKVIDHNS